MAEERWKPAPYPEFADLYEVSDLGRVRRGGCVHKANTSGRNRYPGVILCRPGQRRNVSIHRMVALAFLPIDNPDEMVVHHKDGVKSNRVLSNLAWVTPSENIQHAVDTGLRPEGYNNKLVAKQVRQIIKRAAGGESWAALGRAFGVCTTTITDIVKGKRWEMLGSTLRMNPLRLKALAQIGQRLQRKGAIPKPSGEAHHNAKLSLHDVKEILRLRLAGGKIADIGKQFGVSGSHISYVLRGHSWASMNDLELDELRAAVVSAFPDRSHSLTRDGVKLILERRLAGEDLAAIASSFDLTNANICVIIKGKSWKLNGDTEIAKLRARISARGRFRVNKRAA